MGGGEKRSNLLGLEPGGRSTKVQEGIIQYGVLLYSVGPGKLILKTDSRALENAKETQKTSRKVLQKTEKIQYSRTGLCTEAVEAAQYIFTRLPLHASFEIKINPHQFKFKSKSPNGRRSNRCC